MARDDAGRTLPAAGHAGPQRSWNALTGWQAYAAAAVIAFGALGVHWLLRPWTGDRLVFLFVVPAIVLSALRLGRQPALLALGIGAVQQLVELKRQDALWPVVREDGVALLAYLAAGAVIVWYASRLRVIGARAAAAEQRLNLAQDETGIGVFELDFQANVAVVSSSLCQLVGQPVTGGPIRLDEWLGRLNQGNVDDSRRMLQSKIDLGELRYEREHAFHLPDGSSRWLLSRVRIDLDADGRLAKARGAAMDITARKQADALLERTRAALRQQVHDLERLQALGQRLVAASDELGQPLQAVLELIVAFQGGQRGLLTLCASDGSARRIAAQVNVEPALLDALAALPPGQTACGAAIDAGRRVTVDDIARDTRFVALREVAARAGFRAVHSTPLASTAGPPIGAVTVLFAEPRVPDARAMRLTDICAVTAAALVERERARAAATGEQKRFEVALESSGVPFSILTPLRENDRIVDFRWTYLNTAATHALGLPAAAALGRAVGEALPGVWDGQPMFDAYVQVATDNVQRTFEYESKLSPGMWFEVVASPLRGSVAVWFADISERKRQLRALHDADRRKDEFLATLAHELRNPLAPIRQAVGVASAADATAAQRTWSHAIIERQVQRMAALLDDLLDVSRITRGTLVLRPAPVLLATVVDTAIETARPHLDAKRHALVADLPDRPVLLLADPLRLSQVLGNLLTNAAKYTDDGGRVQLTARAGASGCEIRVADNGVGLSAQQLEQIFELFSQVPESLGRSQDGLGIGLALARALTALHGGQLDAHSDGLGLGSRFTVRLPAACVAEAAATDTPGAETALPSPDAAAGAGEDAALRILIADDNVDAADSLAALLGLLGHTVQTAYDGAQAVAAFTTFAPQVALLDIGMPQLSGLEAARTIRQLPHGREATLIAVTGWGQPQDRDDALAAGFDHHATKPMDIDRLQALLAARVTGPAD